MVRRSSQRRLQVPSIFRGECAIRSTDRASRIGISLYERASQSMSGRGSSSARMHTTSSITPTGPRLDRQAALTSIRRRVRLEESRRSRLPIRVNCRSHCSLSSKKRHSGNPARHPTCGIFFHSHAILGPGTPANGWFPAMQLTHFYGSLLDEIKSFRRGLRARRNIVCGRSFLAAHCGP